ncbi:16S rRNA (cytosine(967)-C(5))-methyltransferase RsmB [Legionella micdadei]|uniref:16S rRNA (cytosine(967)-C(5))-methyltransferase n=1 Tax=Legionella micdadei TaxID=451 RepID=A0A098GCI9_LEGMI|nr:16S rRNA (cytosine(967)-C(5))-methyltransferase RsmB [Legionella micdadei]ARG96484.1 16S rRNA (cytosine(967)-C(5))-methyltransferase [Legionella micdadei]KTD27893.1 Ribosomal RNA small subunit methyltransferase B [Legionella micdadei]CEG59702.1 Ribosomal RNA small subunit methyltransferase B [Legionella micdadei]SCY80124.1 16S rRNA m(5)C-967 methyltransferase [Legionella micdadei]
MKKNERLQALRILLKLLQEKIPLSHLLNAGNDLSPMTKEICFGVCRQYYRLQALADCLVNKRPKVLEIWLVLLMGLYQLHYMQKPDYAVVKETVALLEQLKKSWAKGLVNAVLRTFCRDQQTILARLKANKDFVYGHPDWFMQRLQADWPQDWQDILKANDSHPPMGLRINTRRTQRDQYAERLAQCSIRARLQPYSAVGLTLETPCDVQDLPGFADGDVSVQDESAQIAASLLNLQPGLRVLDACCAPGGKTCHILETEPRLAECVALDVDEKRLRRVAENLSRLGLKANILQGNALQPNNWWDGKQFDRILLDAPCSATGVIRRHPDIKLLRTEEEINKVVDLQYRLLQSLWALLAPKGLLVYATCSVMKEENEQQIARFVASTSDCQFVAENMPWGRSTGHGWQIFPAEANGDGFFYSVLHKL